MKRYLIITFVSVLFAGCSGIKFSSNAVNKTIPDDLKNRTFWSETDIFKYKLEQLTGNIIYTTDSGATFIRGSRVVDEANPPMLETIKDGLLYSSKINRDIETSVSIVAAFKSNLKATNVVDFKVTDIIKSFIDFEKIPLDRIKEIIQKKELKGVKKYYIQGALLTSITSQYANEIKGNAEGVVGGAYGINGKVYNEEATFIQDYKISLALIDLDKLDVLLKGKPLLEDKKQRTDMLKASVSKEVSVNSISGF